MTMTRLLVVAAIVGAAVLTVVALGTAATQSEKYKLSAKLVGGQEVPKAKAPKGAGGSFTGTLVENGSSRKLTWRLTFHGLSGKATAAHIHIGKRGKSGPVAVPLCGPCKSGAHGKTSVSKKVYDALEHGGAYANVHTAKNKNGEIRGQIKPTES
jgi:hypothetical protein